MNLSASGDSPALSIILPAYNEAARIVHYLTDIVTYLNCLDTSYEVLVVDDGSIDRTSDVVERFRTKAPQVRVIRHGVNSGKGFAVRAGMLQARGERCLMADADGSIPIAELPRLHAALDEGADLAIGSRFMTVQNRQLTAHAKWHRTVLGHAFNWAIQHLGLEGISDTQCGFKLFRRAIARDLFGTATINGFALDLEILLLAKRRGYRIAQVSINWADQPGSKVRVLRDGLIVFFDFLRIRRRAARGGYERTPRT